MTSYHYLIIAGILLVVIGAIVLSVFMPTADISTRVAAPVTQSTTPTLSSPTDCLYSEDASLDCLVLPNPQLETSSLPLDANQPTAAPPSTLPSLPETCASVKALHILHCGHVAPEQNHACRTSESEAVYQECLTGNTSPDYSHSHDL